MTSRLVKTLVVISIFALAMGYMESAVVVYLRRIYYPEGFSLPLKMMDFKLGITELFREGATMIMLITLSMLITTRSLLRFAWFIYAFAIWDIAYYLFLFLLLGWPPSLLTWDVLFLIPVIWRGPVLAPLINSFTMIFLAMAILIFNEGGRTRTMTKWQWMLLLAGSALTIVTYTTSWPGFNWLLFILAECLFLPAIGLFYRNKA